MPASATCESCHFSWRTGPDEYQQCPRCVPGQPKPLSVRRRDPTDSLGTEWVWLAPRGPSGEWVRLDDYVLVPREEIVALRDLVDRPEYQGASLFAALRMEILRLRGDGSVPATPANRPRWDELADRCTVLDADLQRKRAECDELRDRVRELEGKKS